MRFSCWSSPRLIALVLALCALPGISGRGSAFAADNRLVAEFWAERQPMIRPQGEYPVRREAAITQMLEEARWTFSGMVYGYLFTYTPYDRRRDVPEQFELDLHARIPWGDPALSVLATRQEGQRFIAQMQYSMATVQLQWAQAWNSRVIPRSAGAGEAPLWPDVSQKQKAVEDAIRIAVRERLRVVSPNKPAAASGRLILTAPPRVWIDSGAYKASVQIRLQVDEIRHYELF